MNTTRTTPHIQTCRRDLSLLAPLFMLSCGNHSPEAIAQIIHLEKLRGTRYLVAQNGEKIVGFVGYWIPGQKDETEPPQIIDLAVLPGFRRQGIGRSLVNAALAAVYRAGFDTAWIQINSERVQDLGFFQSCGFTMVSLIADWCGTGFSKAIFRKDALSEDTFPCPLQHRKNPPCPSK